MKRKILTKEEKAAKKLIELVNDYEIDLDMVGVYLAQQTSTLMYNRLDTVIDSARYYLEAQHDRQNINPLF